MDYRDTPEEIFCSDVFLGHHGIRSTRRELLPLLGALPLTLSGTVALASQIKSETQIALPDVIRWSGWINGFPPSQRRDGERSMVAWTSPGLILS
jgi:hypothetical protein